MESNYPYDPKVICAYRDPFKENQIVYECDDCPHYAPGKPQEQNDPIEGWKAIGCLFIGIALIIAVLFIAGIIIHSVRPSKYEKPKTEIRKD